MMKTLDKRISSCESDKYKMVEQVDAIAGILKMRNYTPASSTGIDPELLRAVDKVKRRIGLRHYRSSLSEDAVGILKGAKKGKRLFIGIVRLDDEGRGAKYNKKWVLEVYGENFVPELENLANDIATLEFPRSNNIEIEVRLDEKEPRDEWDFRRE